MLQVRADDQAEREKQAAHHHTLAKLATWELDLTHAFKRSQGSLHGAMATVSVESPPNQTVPPGTVEKPGNVAGDGEEMLWSPAYRDDELTGIETPAAGSSGGERGSPPPSSSTGAGRIALPFPPLVVAE